jgi:hypothetical protein
MLGFGVVDLMTSRFVAEATNPSGDMNGIGVLCVLGSFGDSSPLGRIFAVDLGDARYGTALLIGGL